MSDHDSTRQDEDISASEFADDERKDGHDFGSWPEVGGLVFTLIVSALIFMVRG
ncbi:hypothetical protein [Thalassospira lucentensis]|uniref:hypothetical protein n=1 Tax=Thalassospira lucentensis TaxID=168935 RepID=UPI00142E883A|nr:hypothetical protein [Thalassospira lucentensis]NIZ02984.1 hypothetical protein [Thalassospira lucentensis]